MCGFHNISFKSSATQMFNVFGMSDDGPGDLCRKLYILYILLTCNAHIMDFKTR